ncbi:MAG: hypothetical protein J7K87_01285 [Candidatus Aenigmarchaeota archaeon]|nr:hypothetical protein [Candidatus Aenigmarchaeota archaeon]
MENEPLNLEKIKKLIEKCARDYEIFGDALIDATFIDIREHLKSAVHGLLKDVEKIKLEINDSYKNEWYNTAMRHYCLSILNECEKKVKKWFSDVISGEEK